MSSGSCKERGVCQVRGLSKASTSLLSLQKIKLFYTRQVYGFTATVCVAVLNTSIKPALESKAMKAVEHGISIYWKDHRMEEKAIDWKMLEWPIVSFWINKNHTGVHRDSRLTAAPFTPGTLLVPDPNLGQILSCVEKMTLVHRSGRFYRVLCDLTLGTHKPCIYDPRLAQCDNKLKH